MNRRVVVPSLVLTLVAVSIGACGSSRPSVQQWEPRWTEAVALMPDLEAGDPSEETCADALVAIRESATDLRPSPAESIDDLVTDWVAIAEDVMFGCPPDTGEHTSFAAAYDELARIEAEVAAGLSRP